MKIVKIDSEKLTFDNGATLSFYHDQDCCESVYADFENMQILTNVGFNFVKTNDLEFNDNLVCDIEFQKDVGFTISDKNGVKLFISCYNCQNGYYSSNLTLIFEDAERREYTINISDCVKDEIY